MAYFIAVHYCSDKKHREALVLTGHARREANNCAEFAAKSFQATKPVRISKLEDLRRDIDKLHIKVVTRALQADASAKDQVLE